MVTSVVQAGGGITSASDGNTTIVFKDADGDGKVSKGDSLTIVTGTGAYTLSGEVGDKGLQAFYESGDPHLYRGVVDGKDFSKLADDVNKVLAQAKTGTVADDGSINAVAGDGTAKSADGTGAGLVQSTYIADVQSNFNVTNGGVTLGIGVVQDKTKGVAIQKNVDVSLMGTDGVQHTLTVRNAFIGDGSDKSFGALQSAVGSMTVADTTNWGEGRAINNSNVAVDTIVTRFDQGATVQLRTMLVGEADGSNSTAGRLLIDVNGKVAFGAAKQTTATVQYFKDNLLHPDHPVVNAALDLRADDDDQASNAPQQRNVVDEARTKQATA